MIIQKNPVSVQKLSKLFHNFNVDNHSNFYLFIRQYQSESNGTKDVYGDTERQSAQQC